ncbi:MAG: hypothetical protein N3A61_05435 [Ignavibacteria bacterium]|nr:hypothetical protein [Ignavibacteria bacterium]
MKQSYSAIQFENFCNITFSSDVDGMISGITISDYGDIESILVGLSINNIAKFFNYKVNLSNEFLNCSHSFDEWIRKV